MILSKQFLPGMRLPSIRVLVKELSISRNTVLNAFEQLIAEGYLEARHGSGTYVAQILPDEVSLVRTQQAAPSSRKRTRPLLSQRGAQLAAVPQMPMPVVTSPEEKPRAFLATMPDVDLFPHAIWERLLAKCWRRASHSILLSYENRAGYLPLREAIAAYLGTARGVQCTAEQVIIIAGSQQGIDLTARILLDPGDGVWLEDPGYLGAYGAFTGAGAQICSLPVDSEGLDVEMGITRYPQARLAFVTPSHQFPLGVTMSLKRRLTLLEWASEADAWILEDDYDSEYRYTGRPLAALQGLDQTDRVLYLGTFSKILFPGLRLGYLVVPQDLVDPIIASLFFATQQPPALEQMVLADFMADGHFARHIRRSRTCYAERQAILVEAAQRKLAGLLDIEGAAAGMHLLGWLPDNILDKEAGAHLAKHQIDTIPLSTYSFDSGQEGALLLGYTALDEQQIREGVKKLAQALLSFPTQNLSKNFCGK
ncbi:PLP-dependent aminotransferase family protein [Chloroflexi bacterium TSY]|nr:PLP-dependent aminotransferase family protein [Chloroflexi bacterium TSY]